MPTGFKDLPNEVQDVLAPHMVPSDATLAAIGEAIVKKRDEAKAARASSGVETIWAYCEEAYVGVDDVNREEYGGAKWAKPMSPDGPVTTSSTTDANSRSTAFVRLTSRYVDAGSAKLAEILLPVDERAFKITETPVPELIKAKDDKSQVVHDGLANQPLMRPAGPNDQQTGQVIPFPAAPMQPLAPGGQATPGTPQPAAAPAMGAVPPAGAAGPPMVPLTVADLANEAIETARAKAKKAEQRIYDWHVKCRRRAEARKVIFDAARLGVGVLKGPVPRAYREIATTKTKNPDGSSSIGIVVNETIRPASVWVNPWNVFPDPACGENIHNGSYIFERDRMSVAQVEDLKKLPGYISKQIDICIEKGPDGKDDGRSPTDPKDGKKTRYEIWYYYGTLKQEEYDVINAAAEDKTAVKSDKEKSVYAIVTLIGSIPVRATLNPLDTGKFPYHSFPWQRRSESWAGIGVGEQIKMPQKTVNGATRALFNNAGISAGVQIVLDQSAIVPADNQWSITPNKIWYKIEGAGGNSVQDAFKVIEIPNVTSELMQIIEYGMKLGEEVTSIPLVTQGQTGKSTPDTLGGMQLQDTNANQLLRSVGYAWDDFITEPETNEYYEWLLLDPDVPDEEKGDFSIDAHGSVALVERAIQDQSLAQLGSVVKDPAYGLDPRRWAKEFLKSKKIDPALISYTEEELKRIDSTPPPPAPAVQVAQIGADVKTKELVMKQGADQRDAANEGIVLAATHQLEAGRIQAEDRRTLVDASTAMHELRAKREIAYLEHATKNNMTISQLQETLAKLDTEKQIAATKGLVDLHKHHVPGAKAQQPPAKV